MMLGNKCDENKREVPYNEAANVARDHDFGLMEVSAKTGEGVEQAFERLVQEIYDQMV